MSLNSLKTSLTIVFIFSFNLASGVRCYNCYVDWAYLEVVNSSCKYPSLGSVDIGGNAAFESTVQYTTYKQDPGISKKGSREVCATLDGGFNGKGGILRAKTAGRVLIPNGCAEEEGYLADFEAVFSGNVCHCDTDLCNGRNDHGSYGPLFKTNNPNNGNNNKRPSENSTGRLLTIGILSTLLTTETELRFLA